MRAEARTKSSAMSRAADAVGLRRHCTGTRVSQSWLPGTFSRSPCEAARRYAPGRLCFQKKRNVLEQGGRAGRAGMMSAAEISAKRRIETSARARLPAPAPKSRGSDSHVGRPSRCYRRGCRASLPRLPVGVSLLRHYSNLSPLPAPPTNSAWKCKGNKREDGRRKLARGHPATTEFRTVTVQAPSGRKSNRGSARFRV